MARGDLFDWLGMWYCVRCRSPVAANHRCVNSDLAAHLTSGLTPRRAPGHTTLMGETASGSVRPQAQMENDLQRLERKIDQLSASTAHLITVVETRKALVEGFDDRLAKAETLERGLASTTLRLAAARVMSSGVAGAIAGLVAGGVVAWLFQGIALAH